MPRRRSGWTTKKRKSTTRAATPQEEDEVWYTVKSIIGEKKVQGQAYYQVDWENNPTTGEVYEPTWAKSSDVTKAAKEEWKLRKAAEEASLHKEQGQEQAPEEEKDGGTAPPSAPQAQKSQEYSQQIQPPRPANRKKRITLHGSRETGEEDSQQSEPPRPANRKRRITIHRSCETGEEEEEEDEEQRPPRKRIGLDFTASPSAEPVPSTTSSVSAISFEAASEEPPVRRSSTLCVEIKNPSDFAASEYHSVQDSQSVAQSSQTISELEADDQRIALVPLSQGTIPDSQDPSSLEAVSQDLPNLHIVASQDLPAQSSSNSDPAQLIIPDSQDKGGSSGLSHPQPSTSDQSGERIFPNSTYAEQDIPSHQPSHLGTQTTAGLDLSIETGTAPETFEETRGDTPESQQEVPEATQEQEQSPPIFFTQPVFTDLNIPQTFSDFQTRSANIKIDEEISSREGSAQVEPEEPTPTASQAAQVAPRAFEEASLNEFTESNASGTEIEHSSVEQGATSPLKEPSHSPEIKIFTAAQEASDSSCQEIPRFKTGNEPTMDSAPPHRVSAILELAACWDDDPVRPTQPASTTEEPQSATEEPKSAAEEPKSAAEELDNILASHEHTVAPSYSSVHHGYFSQPPLEVRSLNKETTPSTQAQTLNLQKATSGTLPIMDNFQPFSNISSSGVPNSGILIPMEPHLTGTVSPADISRKTQAETLTVPLLTGHEKSYDSSNNSITAAQIPQTTRDVSELPDQQQQSTGYIVTLPFQASMRSLYDETILKYRRDITEFNNIFENSQTEPDASLANSIDTLFALLQNLCDYPEDSHDAKVKELEQRVKYYVCANGKMNFIFELLSGIQQDSNTSVLIVARSPNLLRLICDVADFLQVECFCEALNHEKRYAKSTMRLTLSLIDSVDARQFDVVVAYDSAFNDSTMLQDLTRDPSDQPLVLRLATAFSIEHIDQETTRARGSMVHKAGLLWGIVAARKLNTENPPDIRQPHEIAKAFCDYLNYGDAVTWEPEPLPQEILEAWANSQSQMTRDSPLDSENGRKRKLEEEEEEEEESTDNKRMRLHIQSDLPPLTDEVQGMLDKLGFKNTVSTSEAQLSLPLSLVQLLAERLSAAESLPGTCDLEPHTKVVIEGLQKQVQEYEKTYEKVYKRYREAIQDRTLFEDRARVAAEATTAAINEKEESQKKLADLKAQISRMIEESPAENEKRLEEADARTKLLEKRLETSHKNEEYARQAYQDANSAASSMRAEYNELKEKYEDMEKKASENLFKIHETQTRNSLVSAANENARLQIEIEQLKWELKNRDAHTRNGRREARQVSVPRSPRMGSMLSPRPGRFGGSSRGASPAPVIGTFDASLGTYLTPQQAGNGRFAHLR